MHRLLVTLVLLVGLIAGTRAAGAQESPAGTPVPELTETVTPELDPTSAPTPELAATVTAEPTSTAETPESEASQGIMAILGDGGVCTPGPTGNLITSGDRFAQFHGDQSGAPSDYSLSYPQAIEAIGNTNLPGMKFVLFNDGSDPVMSITAGDFAISLAPSAALNVSVQLCQTSDPDALARKVDYTLDPFGPAAVPDCTSIDPSGIGIKTSLLDANGAVFATFDAESQSDGSISPVVRLGSAISMQFSEGLFGTTSDPLAIPYGGGANVGITFYVAGLPGSVTVGLVNSITNGGLSGSTFALYLNDCTGTPIRTTTTDASGNALFKQVLDGTYCVAQTAPRTGYAPIEPIPPFTVTSGQAVLLGPFASDPPSAPLTVHFVDDNNGDRPAPGICAGIFQHSGFPFGTPTGELAPIQCDTDEDGSISYLVPIDVSFEVTVRVLPLGWVVSGSEVGGLSPDDLEGDGGVVTQLVLSGYAGAGGVEITSFFCPVTNASQAHVEMTAIGSQPGATPIPTAGCNPFDATFQVVPYGIGSGYAPITIWTLDGAATMLLPYTGDIVGGVVPNTLHALVDNERPGASGQSVTFEIPSDGVTPARLTILVYGVPVTPPPTTTATATAEPSATATWEPINTPTPSPSSTVVALPNTGAGNTRAGSVLPLMVMLLVLLGTAAIIGRRGVRRGH